MKILVTGFTPFGGETINPSWEAVRALDDSIAGADIIKCEIPTEFEASIDALKAAINAHQPNAILCVGQFGGSPSIQVERVAINLRDGLKAKGYRFALESPTNQQFIIVENSRLPELQSKVVYSFIEKYDAEHTVIRLATSWATTEEQVDELLSIL